LRLENRLFDLAAPRLPVGDQHEDFRIQRLAVQLLIAFQQPDAPVDAALHVRVPGAFVLEAEGRRLLQVIEEKEEGVGIFRQPHLRRRNAGEYRHRDAVVLPAQGIAEHAQEARRSLPAVARHVRHPHRRRGILQDDQVDSGLAQDGRRPARPRDRHDEQRQGGNQAQPERQVAEQRQALADRHRPPLAQADAIGPAPEQTPRPEQQQQTWNGEEPEDVRLPERDVREVDAAQH
jgi:hypothetical protein